MSTLDGVERFASGPHRFVPGSWARALDRRGFAGLDGEMVIDSGRRSRTIRQIGRLQGATAEDLAGQIDAIESLLDGQVHELADNHGREFPRVLLETFDLSTPLQRGRAFWCEYTLTYRQLP